MTKLKTTTLYFDDYQVLNGEVTIEIRKALKKIGVYTYESPNTEGTTTLGFIFSKSPLTRKQVKEIDNDALGTVSEVLWDHIQ